MSGWRLSAPASWAELLFNNGMFSGHWSRPSAMFGSSLGDLALRRVWNHRTHRSRMSSTSLRRTPSCGLASLPGSLTQGTCRSRLGRLLDCVFRLANEVPNEAQHGSLAHLPKILSSIFTAFRRLLLWGSARRCLLAFSPCCHAEFISISTLGPAHQQYAPRGRLERGTNSAIVKSMTSAMSLAMPLMQVPSEFGSSA